MFYEFFTNTILTNHNWQNFLLVNIAVILTAFLVCFLALKYFLKLINRYNICRQPIRNAGPETHLKEKKNTPTMGGLMVIFSTILTAFLWIDIENYLVYLTLLILLSFSAIGFVDDYLKVSGGNTDGFKGSVKLILQFAIVGAVLILLRINDPQYFNEELAIPFSNWSLDLGTAYIIFSLLVVVGSANAVNLTDGLDGLLTVPAVICLALLSFIAYYSFAVQGIFGSEILQLILLCSALIGAFLAFLKYNLKPAKIFMGDVGSLGIGATLGIIAIILRIELVFFIMSLLFVIEALSVILQVASYKIRKKRIFLMAPIHHHFEKLGWKEVKVVKVFWLASLIFGLVGLVGFLYNF